VLLVLASVGISSLLKERRSVVGFEPEGILTLEVSRSGIYDASRTQRYYQTVMEALTKIPAVVSASASQVNGGTVDGRISIQRVCVDGVSTRSARTGVASVAPGFFEVVKAPILGGRDFNWNDRAAVIINKAFADTFYPGVNPIGRTLAVPGSRETCATDSMTVVGTVSDFGNVETKDRVRPVVYVPISQGKGPGLIRAGRAGFKVRIDAAPEAILPAMRQIMVAADPSFGIERISTIAADIRERERTVLTTAGVLFAFGFVALLMASIGIYGTLAYSVHRRTTEVGLRTALGATPRDVIVLILGESIPRVAVGILLGLMGGVGATRVIASRLQVTEPADVFAISLAVVFVLVTATVASLLPAVLAVRIDPMQALKHE
jgi:hypothetical protein